MYVARLQQLVQKVDKLDRRASLQLTLRHPLGLGHYWLVRLGAHLGDSWFWTALLAWLLYDARRYESQRQRRLVGCLVSLALQFVVTLSVKQLVRRPRPFTGHLLYGGGPDNYSFPSGHAMRMAVVAGWAGVLWPGYGPLWGVLGALVGWCRVRLGIHTIGDVLVGWLLGAAIVATVRRLLQHRL